jgi:hypothetical protein
MNIGFSILLDKGGDSRTKLVSYPNSNYRQALEEARTKLGDINDPSVEVSVVRAYRTGTVCSGRRYEIVRLVDEKRVFVSRTSSKKDISKNISHLEVPACYNMMNKEIIEKYKLSYPE